MANQATKRFNLEIPVILMDKLNEFAKERNVDLVELLRQFIRLGMLVIDMQKKGEDIFVVDPDTKKLKKFVF